MKTETNRQLAERVLGNVDARLAAAQCQAQTLAERLERVGAMWSDPGRHADGVHPRRPVGRAGRGGGVRR